MPWLATPCLSRSQQQNPACAALVTCMCSKQMCAGAHAATPTPCLATCRAPPAPNPQAHQVWLHLRYFMSKNLCPSEDLPLVEATEFFFGCLPHNDEVSPRIQTFESTRAWRRPVVLYLCMPCIHASTQHTHTSTAYTCTSTAHAWMHASTQTQQHAHDHRWPMSIVLSTSVRATVHLHENTAFVHVLAGRSMCGTWNVFPQ